jgi:hypothetical protein
MIVVFVGPTLSIEAARRELDAVYLPPAAQGDVYRIALRKPRAIGIVDGYFQQVRSVWHKEILWAMHQGIPVYGGASMGALRAAELADFGMRGVGRIFDDFYADRLEDDDEVAVVHGPPDTGYRALSEAMVNIRATLERAVGDGVIDEPRREALVAIARSMFYPDRSYARLLELAAGKVEGLDALPAWLRDHRVDQKAADALAMLRRMGDDDLARPEVDFHFEHTNLFEATMRHSGVAGASLDGTMLPTDRLIEELRIRGTPFLTVTERALLRESVARAARATGASADERAIARFEHRFRAAHDLLDDEALSAWLAHNDMTRDDFAALIREEVLVRAWRAGLDSGGLLRQLRLDNDYGDLRERAEVKERRLRARGLERANAEDVGHSEESLLAWYFARLGRPRPADLGEYARTFGFADEATLLRAVAREYAFVSERPGG